MAARRLSEKHVKVLLKYWGQDRNRKQHGYPQQNAWHLLKLYQDFGVVASLQGGYQGRALIHSIPRVFMLVNQAMESIRETGGSYSNECMAVIETYYVLASNQLKVAEQLGCSRAALANALRAGHQLLILYFNNTAQGSELCQLLYLYDTNKTA